MKNLVENKLRTSKDEDVKMNTRCSAILQNQLPYKEEEPGRFALSCSIGELTSNALADLGASISVMPLLMFSRLGIRGLKPINMTIEMADKTQSTLEGIMENLHIKIDNFFPVGDLLDNTEEKCYWCFLNDDKRIDVAWEELSLNDWRRDDMPYMNVDLDIRPNIGEDCEHIENFREEKEELILDTVLDKLDNWWFSGIIKDEDDLNRIVDYLELKSYDGFIDVEDEAYKERMCEFIGMTYTTPQPILMRK
nr:hypothetical protein [Tanacetum cinerariifolium]